MKYGFPKGGSKVSKNGKNKIEVLSCGTWDPTECDDHKWGGGTCDGCGYQKWVTLKELLKEEK